MQGGGAVLNTKMNSRIPKHEVIFRVTTRQEASPKDSFFSVELIYKDMYLPHVRRSSLL